MTWTDQMVFALAVLNDDHGITTIAYEKLLTILSPDNVAYLQARVKAVDGRYFLP